MSIVIAVPVDENLASFIGKKGSSESITFYNRKAGDETIVALFPGQEEEKVYALAETLLLASQIVISTSLVDKKFGEALVAASLLNRRLLLTADNDVKGILGGAGITNFKVVQREDLLNDIIANRQGAAGAAQVRVEIDKAFPVKGVGTIALGIVTRGTVKQHDKLYHTSGKQVVIRSIQSQDEDVLSAGTGTRVGLSLKDMSHDEIEKGDLLTSTPVKRCGKVRIECKGCKVAPEAIQTGAHYRLVLGFSVSDCAVLGVDGAMVELELKAPMPAEVGDEALLIRSIMPRIFASGTVKEAK